MQRDMTESLLPEGTRAELPVLPLRNSVLFPTSVVPVNVGRPRSVRLVEATFDRDRPSIAVFSQRDPQTEDPGLDDLHPVGTLARVLKVIRLSSDNYSVVLQGIGRIRRAGPGGRDPGWLTAEVERISEPRAFGDEEVDALRAHLREAARQLAELLPSTPRDATSALEQVQEAGALADLVASNLPVGTDVKQSLLEEAEVRSRLRRVLEVVNRQREVFKVKREISTMVQEEMSRSQREYLLRQQMKAIRRELGEIDDDEDEVDTLRDRVAQAEMPTEAEKAAKKQLSRMRSMSPAGAEYQVARTYVEWLVDLPWGKTTADRLDVPEARRCLDEDHHGLDRAKRRILEYIAVRKLRTDTRGPILCFVGPPGVGKTSLGRSIARATGRNFVRTSLGGAQDEAQIRGHRRTYVGAYPGRIVGALKKAGSKNPVVLLDEVDKLGNDFRGDPASALLEVLDPEQNAAFQDHYIEVPVDLSQILFVATANRIDTIPAPLLDRMEVIDLPGYTRDEKHAIAREFLVPKQLSDHGLTPEQLEFTDAALQTITDEYTREAGVRLLEQRVGALCRAVAVRYAEGEDVSVTADPPFVREVLGPSRHEPTRPDRKSGPGVATGLAWTPQGGDLLLVESTRMPGNGKIHVTGRLGDVLKESVAAAMTYIRTRTGQLGLSEDFLTKTDVHVHLPHGSIPKDGPSAGLPVLISLASLLTRLPARSDTASTGEITLRGTMLRVDGVKEKCIAAHRAGIRRVILPKRNEPDLDDVPEHVRRDLEVVLVQKVDEVIGLALDTGAAPDDGGSERPPSRPDPGPTPSPPLT